MSQSVVFIHTSPAAIGPVNNFFKSAAASLTITNLLDDGVLRMFADADYSAVESQLLDLIAIGSRTYGAKAAVITCSAVPRASMERVRAKAPVPVLKIDVPMAEATVRAGRRVGVLYTFAPTLKPTTALLEETASDAGLQCELQPALVSNAYDALLMGRTSEHDSLVLEAAKQIAPSVDVIVLAQVSMAHLENPIEAATSRRTFSSPGAALAALKNLLGGFD